MATDYGTFNWPGSGASAGSNASVSLNGQPIPLSSTLIAAENPSLNQTPLQADASGNLLVSLASPSALPTGASTSALQTTGNTSLASIDTKTPTVGQKAMAASSPIVIASDQSSIPVTIAGNQAVNVAQINAVTPLMGNGVTGTGSQRVTIASDNTAFSVNAVQSGTWTFQPGNTANTTAWLTTQAGRTQANAPVYNLYSSTNVTTSAYVQLVASTTSATSEIEIYDTSGSIIYLATGAAASEVNQIIIPQGGNGRIPLKIAASTRISVKAVDATAATGALVINFYT